MRRPIALTLALLLVACGHPVPKEKAAYVGQWQATQMSLVITQEGSVHYRRQEGGSSKSIDAPLKGFSGDNFEVGVGPMSTTFVVSAPPHPVGNQIRMTVDGVELVKSQLP